MYLMFRSVYPGLHLTLEDMVAEGDKVVVHYIARGTHKAELMGVAPTGKQVTAGASLIERLAGGKIVEHWEVFDAPGMMQQIGAISGPGEGEV
jgi:predicted ester cyclase